MTEQDKLNRTQRTVTTLLSQIAEHFVDGSVVVLLVQHPDKPESSMILGNAGLDEAAKIIDTQKKIIADKRKGGHS